MVAETRRSISGCISENRPNLCTSHFAAKSGEVLTVIAIGALAAQDGCSCVIAGATTPEQVKANAAAAEWIPTAEDLADLDRVVPPPSRR